MYAIALTDICVTIVAVSLSTSAAMFAWMRIGSYRAEKKLRREKREQGRFLDWASVQKRLARGEGSLIINHDYVHFPGRCFWTPKTIGDLKDVDELFDTMDTAFLTFYRGRPTARKLRQLYPNVRIAELREPEMVN